MTCEFCGGTKGSFWRATYVDAPEGGVPVHIECASKFFATLPERRRSLQEVLADDH